MRGCVFKHWAITPVLRGANDRRRCILVAKIMAPMVSRIKNSGCVAQVLHEYTLNCYGIQYHSGC